MTTTDWHWEAQILGAVSDLEYLARHFRDTTHARVFRNERDGSFLFRSIAFNTCETSEQVLIIAEEELAVLSGIIKLELDTREQLCLGAVQKRYANGRRDLFVHVNETLHLQAEIGEVTVTVTDAQGNIIQQQAPQQRTVAISILASQDAAVKKAMRLYSAPEVTTWVGLYRLHEVIEDDIGGEHQLQKRNWVSKDDLKRFKHSANSVTVAGDASRHGKEHNQPPSNPMTIEEAGTYVNQLMHSWLTSKSV